MSLATGLTALGLIVVGGAFLLAGYRLYRLLIPIWGFIVGFELTVAVGLSAFQSHILATPTGWMLAALVGLIFAALAYGYYYLSVVLLAGSVGFVAGEAMASAFVTQPSLTPLIVGIIAAVALVALTIRLNLPKALVILLTALSGAGAVVLGVALLFGGVSLATLQGGAAVGVEFVRGSWLFSLLTLALGLVGVVAQVGRRRIIYYTRARIRRMQGAPLWPVRRT